MRRLLIVVFMGMFGLVIGRQAVPAQAATFTVTNATDCNGAGCGSLRRAINDANAAPGPDTINITAIGTLTLLSNIPEITQPLTIVGPGSASFTITASCNLCSAIRLASSLTASGFTIDGATLFGIDGFTATSLNLQDVVIKNVAPTDPAGRAIDVNNATITLNNVTVTNTTPQDGGSVVLFNPPSVSITNSTFSNNKGEGLLVFGAATTTVRNTHFTNNAFTSGSGGGFRIVATDLTLEDSVFSGNTASDFGGGLATNMSGTSVIRNTQFLNNNSGASGGGFIATGSGSLLLENAVLSGNSGTSGGGISLVGGTTVIRDSQVLNNRATSQGGGGLFIDPATTSVTIDRSLIAGNTAVLSGGGLINNSVATVSNSTIYGNSSQLQGGGIRDFNTSTTNLNNVTITANSAPAGQGGGIRGLGGAINMRNTIIAGNTGGGDCSGTTLISQGNNLASDGTCNLTGAGDKPSTAPGFATGTLANNGGPTQTVALAANSAAVDAGSNAAPSCAAGSTDQRGAGFARVLDGNGDGAAVCDIGAYELGTVILPTPTPVATATPVLVIPPPPAPIPQVFQNPGALAAVGVRPVSTPTPRVAVAPAIVAPAAALQIVISPPRTGDAGLR